MSYDYGDYKGYGGASGGGYGRSGGDSFGYASREVLVPDQVKKFVKTFHKHVRDRNVYEIHNSYDIEYKKLRDRFFTVSRWPTAEAIADIVNYDETFIVLYREMYYRHVYSQVDMPDSEALRPTLTDSMDSFQNYIDLFNILLGQSDKTPTIDLPNQWIWDIIDQFINQFQHFSGYKTAALHSASSHEKKLLSDNKHVWSAQTVLRYLHALASKGRVNVQFNPPIEDEYDIDEVSNIAKMMGYFSVIGLMRVHCISGDYRTGLQVLDAVDLRKRSPLIKLTPCYVTTYYHLGFSYLMMGRYVDATRTITQVLQMSNFLKNDKNEDRKIENLIARMKSLLAIVFTICPQKKRVDENLLQQIQDKHRETYRRLQSGEESAFEHFFSEGCPSFISLAPPDLDAKASSENAAYEQQLDVFLKRIRSRQPISDTHGVLKLYSTIPTNKLAKTLKKDVESLSSTLASIKNKTRGLQWSGGPPMVGNWNPSHDIDFYVEKDTVHVKETKAVRRYGEFFMRNINRTEEMIDDVSKFSYV